ncbi:hypothetical protein AQ436_00055 [Arthrobacter sp. EpRS66]|nr:hypothetical protein AQ436_00055 [Arthrobacter sp. EpRS66]
MARTVKLEIDAKVTGLVNGLKTAQKATQDSAREFDKWSQQHEQSLDTVSKGMMGFGAVVGGGAVLAVKKFADFDKAMSGVQAATHETEANMGLLRQAAIDAGADTAFSAQEAAAGIEELAKAGVSTRDVIGGGLTGALDLAAAGQLSVGESAEIAASAMTQFKLSGDQIPHLADLLAAGAGKAQGSVHDLGEALNQSGLVASATGLSIEETTGGLAAFASAGLTGSDAGTSFKTMLQRLTPQSKEAQKKFDELGISAYDAQGNFVGLTDFAGQLQTQMADLSPEARNAAMSVMFGSDAVRASNVLYEQGAKGIQGWIDQVNDAGYASETAALLQNNLAGDLEKLGGAFDTVFIQSGGAANDALRGLVQGAEAVVDVIGKIPAPVLGMGTMFAGVAGGAALLAGGVINVLPKIRDTRDAMNDLFPAGSKGAAGIGKVGKAMGSLARGGAVAGGILAVGTGLAKIAEATYLDDIAQGTGRAANGLSDMVNKGAGVDALNTAFQKIDGSNLMDGTDGIGAMDAAIQKLFADDPGTKFDNWGQRTVNSLTGIKGTTQIAEEAFGTLDTELANMLNSGNADGAASAFEMIQQKLRDSGVSAEEAAYLFPAYSDALQRADAEAKNAAGGTGELDGALEGVGGTAEEVALSLDDIIASLFELGVLTRDVRSAEADFEASIDAVTSSIAENGKTLDITTEKGRNNQAALDGLAASGQAYTESLAQSGASEKELQASMQGTYDSLITAAGQFGITGGKADELARQIMGVPPGVDIDTWMDDSAKAMAEATANAIELIPGYTKVSVAVSEDGTVGQVQSRINEITGKTEYVFVTDDGTVQNVQAGIANINGKDVPVYVGDDGTVYSTQGKINGIKGKDVTITATAATGGAESALNSAARDRYSTIHTRVVTTKETYESTGRGGRGGVTRASGGSVFGPGTETSDSIPAWLSTNEHVLSAREVRGLGGHGSVERLRALARNGQAPAFATGGAVGRKQAEVDRLQRQFSLMPGDKKNKARKAALKADLYDAKYELKQLKAEATASKKSSAAAKKAATEAKKKADEARKAEAERQTRLSEARFDLRRDLKRGEITDSFTSGSGMSVVDRLFEQSSNKDLSKGKRSSLRSTAYGMESQLLSLEKRSESLKTKLEKATEARDRLLEVSKSVASGLRGEYSLGGVLSNLLSGDQKGPLSAGSFVKSAQGKAAQIKRFGVMLSKLRKKGYNEAIIQEIADLGTTEGTQVGNALLGATGKERDQLNQAYKSMDYWSGKAGVEVTRSMERGGIDAAEGLVRGLEGKTEDVEDAFYKLGKNAEKAFKRSLGIKSPSRVMKAAGVHVGEGAELGILSKVDDVSLAAEKLMTPPALMVPPSPEVSRYANAQGASGAVSPEAIAQAVRAGMSGWQPMVQIDGRKFYGAMVNAEQQYGKRR